MATPNLNDNTQLGTGEQISNEAVDTNAPKLDPNLPVSQTYKLPRSKIVVGAYGVDGGDVTVARPLPVDSLLERRELELNALRDRGYGLASLQRSAAECRNNSTLDVRGHLFDTRGKR
jgi:hypothetical protein